MVMMPLSLVRLMEEYAQVEIDDKCFQIMAQNALSVPCSCHLCKYCENVAEENDNLCEACLKLCLCAECDNFEDECSCRCAECFEFKDECSCRCD